MKVTRFSEFVMQQIGRKRMNPANSNCTVLKSFTK